MQNLDPAVLEAFRGCTGQVEGAWVSRSHRGLHALAALRPRRLLRPGDVRGLDQPGPLLRHALRGAGRGTSTSTSTTSSPRSARANFGDEAKRRILLGTFCRMVGFRDRYYLKALAVRQLIIEEYQATAPGPRPRSSPRPCRSLPPGSRR